MKGDQERRNGHSGRRRAQDMTSEQRGGKDRGGVKGHKRAGARGRWKENQSNQKVWLENTIMNTLYANSIFILKN